MSVRLHTSLPESHDTGPYPFTPLFLQPRLATSRSAFLTFTLSNLRLIGLHPIAPLYTGASLCPLHPTQQHWDTPTLQALPTSLHTQDSNATGLLVLCLGHTSSLSPLQEQPSSASYSIQSCQTHLWAYLLLFFPLQQ